ncbi:MAG: TonB-dependent receptor [Flammeovirgaceae bacterium]
MMNWKSMLTLCLALFVVNQALAQKKQVEGTIQDAKGTPLIGASITFKGLSQGVVADEQGKFSLEMPAGIDSICISFVGYETLCMGVQNSLTSLVITLKESNSLIFGGVTIEDNRIIENFSATQVSSIRPSVIREANTATAADLLEHTGQVFVQRSQQGGGSPVLRGLEANRILLMVDGMRINNAIFRSGHLQNVLTVDQNILEGADVYFGPNSLTYGSDALGGVVNFKTRQPIVGDKLVGNFLTRYSSANNERMGHADVSYTKGKWAGLSSITFSKFGVIQAGKNENPFNDFQWRRDSLVIRSGNEDIIVASNDPYNQTPNGFHQWNVNQKFRFEPNSLTAHTLSVGYTTTSDLPRYDRLILDEEGNFANSDFRYAEWYYGPQKRFSAAYSLDMENDDEHGLWDILQFIAFYQSMEESRINRRFGRDHRRNQIERVNSIGAKLDMQLQPDWGRVQVGLEAYYDDVNSEAFSENILTGARGAEQTRYPDGGSGMINYGIYASVIRDFKTWQFSAGLRYSYAALHAELIDDSFFQFPFEEIDQRNSALTGSVNLTKKWGKFKLNTLFSSAFRAPNVDDVSKIFDSQVGESIILPNEELDAEQAFNYELAGLWKSEKLSWQVSVYHNWLRNMIQRANSTFNGQDSIMVNGILTNVLANENIGTARIYGFYAGLTYTPWKSFTLDASVSYTKGIDTSADEDIPLAHIPPLYGRFSMQHISNKLQLRNQFFIQFNGWKRIEDYGPESSPDRLIFAVPNEGMPAWFTLNYRASWQVKSNIQLQFGVDNILDTHYRTFSSGLNAPGRNFIIALRGNL